MEPNQINMKVPEHWYVRQTEHDGVMVLIPPTNPGSTPFRPSIVVSSSDLGEGTSEEDIEQGEQLLESMLQGLVRRPVEIIDAAHLVNRYSYIVEGLEIRVTEFRTVRERVSLNVVASCAAADGESFGADLDAIAREVHFAGGEPWPALEDAADR